MANDRGPVDRPFLIFVVIVVILLVVLGFTLYPYLRWPP